MHAARYSYLSLTSAGVASDLPFVTLRGNKQGLARVGKKTEQNKSGVCCSPNGWQEVSRLREAATPAWLLHGCADVLGL